MKKINSLELAAYASQSARQYVDCTEKFYSLMTAKLNKKITLVHNYVLSEDELECKARLLAEECYQVFCRISDQGIVRQLSPDIKKRAASVGVDLEAEVCYFSVLAAKMMDASLNAVWKRALRRSGKRH